MEARFLQSTSLRCVQFVTHSAYHFFRLMGGLFIVKDCCLWAVCIIRRSEGRPCMTAPHIASRSWHFVCFAAVSVAEAMLDLNFPVLGQGADPCLTAATRAGPTYSCCSFAACCHVGLRGNLYAGFWRGACFSLPADTSRNYMLSVECNCVRLAWYGHAAIFVALSCYSVNETLGQFPLQSSDVPISLRAVCGCHSGSNLLSLPFHIDI